MAKCILVKICGMQGTYHVRDEDKYGNELTVSDLKEKLDLVYYNVSRHGDRLDDDTTLVGGDRLLMVPMDSHGRNAYQPSMTIALGGHQFGLRIKCKQLRYLEHATIESSGMSDDTNKRVLAEFVDMLAKGEVIPIVNRGDMYINELPDWFKFKEDDTLVLMHPSKALNEWKDVTTTTTTTQKKESNNNG